MPKHQLYLNGRTSQIETPNSIHQPDEEEEKPQENENIEIVNNAPKMGSENESDSDVSKFDLHLKNRQPYSLKEDEMIINYILKGQNIHRTSSISLWKYLESRKDNPKRTYQSLKNRFLRNIRPYLLTRYRYLIKDESAIQNILWKFPELKKREAFHLKKILKNQSKPTSDNIHIAKPLTKNKPKLTSKRDENGSENLAVIEFDEQFSMNTSQENGNRKFDFNKGIISITFVNDKVQFRNPECLGIYEKWLKLKTENRITPCSYCGRGEPELDEAYENESDILVPDSCHQVSTATRENDVNNHSSLEKLNESPSLLQSEIKIEDMTVDPQTSFAVNNNVMVADRGPDTANKDTVIISRKLFSSDEPDSSSVLEISNCEIYKATPELPSKDSGQNKKQKKSGMEIIIDVVDRFENASAISKPPLVGNMIKMLLGHNE